MKPVVINAFDRLGPMAAASILPFGAAATYAAAGTVQGTLCSVEAFDILGIVEDDKVEKTQPGFYSQYDAVPLVTAGRVRVWITPNNTTAVDIKAGDYLDLAVLNTSNANTLPIGVFEESGSQAGQTRVTSSLARALEDVDLVNDVVPTTMAVGATSITLSEANMTTLDLSVGDYLLLNDLSANSQVNRVESLTTTVITLQVASTVALTSGDSDTVGKLVQGEVMLL